MATLTLGSNAQTTLTALLFSPSMNTTDFATLQQLIRDERSHGVGIATAAPSAKPVFPGALTRSGFLSVPNRGILRVLPGDYVAVDANGWPILLSANAIAGGASPSAVTSWTHS